MQDFFAMGGYAGFVWGAYGVSALALGLLVWLVLRRRAAARRRLEAVEARRLSEQRDA